MLTPNESKSVIFHVLSLGSEFTAVSQSPQSLNNDSKRVKIGDFSCTEFGVRIYCCFAKSSESQYWVKTSQNRRFFMYWVWGQNLLLLWILNYIHSFACSAWIFWSWHFGHLLNLGWNIEWKCTESYCKVKRRGIGQRCHFPSIQRIFCCYCDRIEW